MTQFPVSRQQKNTSEWWLFATLIIGLTAFYIWYGWRWVPGIVQDQGWFLQVSSRVAQGDVLYRDVLWAYGPLPVLVMSWLMQLGRHDIVYYSAMNISLATLTTLVLYFLHRFVFSPHGAVIATLIITIGLGTWSIFLQSYNPGIAFGNFGTLTTLWGILKAITNQADRIAISLVAVGIAVSCLSKPEFAFAACALAFLLVISLCRVRIKLSDNTRAARIIFIGMATGIVFTSLVYFSIASTAGWGNVWAGVTGYDQLRYIRNQLIGYYGLTSWASITLACVWIITIGITLAPFHRKIRIVSITSLTVFNLVASLAVTSGWLTQVRNRQISVFDLSAIQSSIAKLSSSAWAPWFNGQTWLMVSITTFVLVFILFIKWTRRWYRREMATQEQWIVWATALFMQLVGLRFIFNGNVFPMFAILILYATIDSEFSAWRFKNRSALRILFALLVTLLLIGGLTGEWYYAKGKNMTTLESHYGTILVHPITRDFLVGIQQYIDDHSQSEDSVAVLGPFPGIYYLSERHNPFRQDYQIIGVGENEFEAQDFLDRLDRSAPPVLLAPEGGWNMGILDVHHDADSAWLNWSGQPAFRKEASRVEKYILDHYEFDRMLGSPDSYKLAAFKRIR